MQLRTVQEYYIAVSLEASSPGSPIFSTYAFQRATLKSWEWGLGTRLIAVGIGFVHSIPGTESNFMSRDHVARAQILVSFRIRAKSAKYSTDGLTRMLCICEIH